MKSLDEKPTEKYTDVGGLDKQIEELVEAIVWPMKEAERFKKIGIKAPKGKSRPWSKMMLWKTAC